MNTKQRIAIAGVLVAGAVLGGYILTTEPGKGPDAAVNPSDEKHAPGDADEAQHAASGKDQAGEDSHDHDKASPAQAATAGGAAAQGKSAERAGEDSHDHDKDKPAQAARPGSQAAQGRPAEQPGRAGSAPGAPKLALTDEQMRAAGIALDQASPAQLATDLTLPGEIGFDQDRTAHVVPRVAGVVEAVHAGLGQQVKKGQVLALIASAAISDQRSELAGASRRLELARTTFEREKQLWEEKISARQDYEQARAALQEAEIAVSNARQKLAAVGVTPNPAAGNRFELRAPFDGVVLEKHVALGEAVSDSTNIFTVSDLSTVWANFNVPANALQAVRVGSRAVVRAPAMGAEVAGTVSYVGSLLGEQTRTATARVTLRNPQGAWRPGLFVNVSLATGQRSAPVTVASEAIQTLDGKPQVFVRTPGGFTPHPVELGASNGRRVEIVRGLEPGATVAAAGSFVLKSEAEKGSATHAH